MISQEQQRAICELQHENPHDYLGLHKIGKQWIIRAYEPFAESLSITDINQTYLGERGPEGFFQIKLNESEYPSSQMIF